MTATAAPRCLEPGCTRAPMTSRVPGVLYSHCAAHTAWLMHVFADPELTLRQPPCDGFRAGCPRRSGWPCLIADCASRTALAEAAGHPLSDGPRSGGLATA